MILWWSEKSGMSRLGVCVSGGGGGGGRKGGWCDAVVVGCPTHTSHFTDRGLPL